MKFFLENHSGHVNIDSGLLSFSIHFSPESIFTSRRNPYSHHSGTIIHMPRNPQFTRTGERRGEFLPGESFAPHLHSGSRGAARGRSSWSSQSVARKLRLPSTDDTHHADRGVALVYQEVHRCCAAYARQGRQGSARDNSSAGVSRRPNSLAAAHRSPGSLAGKASGSRKARSATYCAVHSSMPVICLNR